MDREKFNLEEQYMVKKPATVKTAALKAATLKAAPTKPVPCAPKKTPERISIFSPWKNKMVNVKPYGPTAKKLYRFYARPA